MKEQWGEASAPHCGSLPLLQGFLQAWSQESPGVLWSALYLSKTLLLQRTSGVTSSGGLGAREPGSAIYYKSTLGQTACPL
jgi:hypothetical protein